ncbi:MAG: response regulator [Accumulibacter sp.]|jgi:FixJ family two-component response regulator|uniref:response regulator transcription factor n=1 Tax=Accumulibacter sp. TaxID=2053492 RepID=UPI002FC313FA
MGTSLNTVFIVEDDQSVRDALGLLLGLQGFSVVLFADAEGFLAARHADWSGCLLIDIRMPGMDGLTLQKRLLESGCSLPVIVMTGHGDVESARQAFRAQAVDFIEKPIDHDKLLRAIDEAFSRQSASQEQRDRQTEATRLLATLTPREREVMDQVVAGRHNRDIARALDISPRTVEVHKARLLAKLRVNSIADLVRLSLQNRDTGQG